MSDTSPIKKRRVFWTLCTLQTAVLGNGKFYKKEQMQTDLPPETTEEEARDYIFDTYGRITDGATPGFTTPKQYGEVNSSRVVTIVERVKEKAPRHVEGQLFSGEEMFKAQGRRK